MKNQLNNPEEIVYHVEDLCELLHFGKSKVLQMARRGSLPVIKVGKTYITTNKLLERWFLENEGKSVQV